MHCLLALTNLSDTLLALAGPLKALDSLWPYIVMLLGFSLIVFVHELGHFLVAKWADVRVERFAVGFGREIFGFTRGETRYSFNILPIGGYVKMLGQEDFDDKSKELMFKDDPRSFVNKPVRHRMAIVSAGVIMNVLFAGLLFMVVFLIGMEATSTRIAYVEPDSPADRAGIQPGDIIKKMNGSTIREFREVFFAVMLADVHEPMKFLIERDGEEKTFSLNPEYLIPDNTREARRLMVGIAGGVTREIVRIGPEIDTSRPDSPHVGDVIVEIDGVPITDDKANEAIEMLAYASGEVVVERKDAANPDATPQRVRVNIPPILQLQPDAEGSDAISVLGLSPLVRISVADPRGRAAAAGLEAGDTVLSWDDIRYPTGATVVRAIRECPDRDIHFTVRKLDGRVQDGFVRPKQNRRGAGTIQSSFESAGDEAVVTAVRRGGIAASAGLQVGDVIVACGGVENPSAVQVRRAVATNVRSPLSLGVHKKDGRFVDVSVRPEATGSVDASFDLIADDTLRVSDVVATIHGKPSPAAQSGMKAGALITAVGNQPVSSWRELINAFRSHAGTTAAVTYVDHENQPRTAQFPVPHSPRTLLGAGPEARILSVDGRRTFLLDTSRGKEEVAVGYRKGLLAILDELAGRRDVAVEYRATPLSDIATKTLTIPEERLDPWLGRIAFMPNVRVKDELTILKGENALEALQIGLHKTYYFMVNVYTTIERIFFSRSVGVESISGPLGIFDVGGKVARAGFVQFIFFMGIISANLAVINFLPLPIVDGGLMVFLIIEKIKGSPVSLRVQVATQMVGLFLIIGVFLYVTFNDAMRLWG